MTAKPTPSITETKDHHCSFLGFWRCIITDNRTRILQTARDLFNTRGYRSVTTQDIAEQLGMSKKTIYKHFASKEEIATAVVEETMDKVRRALHLSELPEADPLFVIKEILINVKDDSTRFGSLFVMDIEKYLPDLAARFNRFRKEKNQNIERLLLTAQEKGLVKDNIPIPLATEILKTSLKAIVHSHSLPHTASSLEDKINLFLDIFCHGLAEPIRKEE